MMVPDKRSVEVLLSAGWQPGGAQAPLRMAVVGASPAGLSSAVMLAQKHHVVLQDASSLLVHMINAGLSPYKDPELQHWLEYQPLNLRATLYPWDAIQGAQIVLVGLPTDYIDWAHTVDTATLDHTLEQVLTISPQALVVIESTVPVGYTRTRMAALQSSNLMVCPAALRPGKIMRDRLRPKLMVVGERSSRARWLAQLLSDPAQHAPHRVLYCGSAEAEALELLRQRFLITRSVPTHEELARYAKKQLLDLDELSQGLQQFRDLEPVQPAPRPAAVPSPSVSNAAHQVRTVASGPQSMIFPAHVAMA